MFGYEHPATAVLQPIEPGPTRAALNRGFHHLKKLLVATMVLFTFQAWAGVVCESLEFCRVPEGYFTPYELPGLTFQVTGPTDWVIGADVWFSSGCQGDADSSCRHSTRRLLVGRAVGESAGPSVKFSDLGS